MILYGARTRVIAEDAKVEQRDNRAVSHIERLVRRIKKVKALVSLRIFDC